MGILKNAILAGSLALGACAPEATQAPTPKHEVAPSAELIKVRTDIEAAANEVTMQPVAYNRTKLKVPNNLNARGQAAWLEACGEAENKDLLIRRRAAESKAANLKIKEQALIEAESGGEYKKSRILSANATYSMIKNGLSEQYFRELMVADFAAKNKLQAIWDNPEFLNGQKLDDSWTRGEQP